jgi:hypothetical protein
VSLETQPKTVVRLKHCQGSSEIVRPTNVRPLTCGQSSTNRQLSRLPLRRNDIGKSGLARSSNRRWHARRTHLHAGIAQKRTSLHYLRAIRNIAFLYSTNSDSHRRVCSVPESGEGGTGRGCSALFHDMRLLACVLFQKTRSSAQANGSVLFDREETLREGLKGAYQRIPVIVKDLRYCRCRNRPTRGLPTSQAISECSNA